MFNIVEKNQKLVKGIMIVITITFVTWGIGSYLGMMGDDGYVAKVGSNKIYERDIDNAMQQNKQATDKMQVLFSLINRQLLLNDIASYHLVATTSQLQNAIANIPLFQESGTFSVKKYEDFLRTNFISANQFQNNTQEQILINQTVDLFKNSYFNSSLFTDKFATLLSQERNISTYTVDPKKFYPQINITDKQINDYYKQNIAQFTTPEQVKVQYLELNPDTISANIQIPATMIDKYVQDHQTELNNVQVDVSHILFNVLNNATPEQKAEIKTKAEKVLAMAKANPSKFAELATKYSQDTGSAKKGGDLGFFAHGVMVPAFEKVAFTLKPNEISGLVETQFGFHILKLNAKKETSTAELQAIALAKLKKQQATSTLQQAVDKLNELTYNKPKTLDQAAQTLNLTLKTSDFVGKDSTTGLFANPKVQKAIFSNDAVKNRNNTEVIDLGNNSYAVFRVTDYKQSQVQPLENVKNKIITDLKATQASQMALKEVQDDITKLNNGTLKLAFIGNQNINMLAQNPDITPMTVKQIFGVSINKLPAYTNGVNQKNEFVIYQINKESINKDLIAQNKKMLEQFNSNNAMVDFGAYLTELKSKYSVSYKADRLTPTNTQAQ